MTGGFVVAVTVDDQCEASGEFEPQQDLKTRLITDLRGYYDRSCLRYLVVS